MEASRREYLEEFLDHLNITVSDIYFRDKGADEYDEPLERRDICWTPEDWRMPQFHVNAEMDLFYGLAIGDRPVKLGALFPTACEELESETSESWLCHLSPIKGEDATFEKNIRIPS